MSKTKDSVSLIIGTIILLLIGTLYGIPLDEFFVLDKIIEETDNLTKVGGELGRIQEESTNSAKLLYIFLKIVTSIIGMLLFISAGKYLYDKYISD